MKKNNYYFFIFVLIVFFFSCSNEKKMSEIFQKENFSIDSVGKYIIYKEETIKNDHFNIYQVFAKWDVNFLRLKIIYDKENESAKKYITTQINKIDNLFSAYNAPYPGQISNLVECDKKYNPKKIQFSDLNMEIVSFNLYANKFFSYGACSDDLLHYRSIFAIIYCKKRDTIFEMYSFIPKNKIDYSFDDLLKSFKCNR